MTAVLRRRGGGGIQPLSLHRWGGPATPGERALLGTLGGPVLDLGCGPGRLVVALAELGTPALGVDASEHAVARAASRGAAVLRRSIFDRLPGEGRWASVLLFDGNIGIGGAPGALMTRAASLLAPRGTVVVETEPPGSATLVDEARLERGSEITAWFPWAWVDAMDIDDLARSAGLSRIAQYLVEGRWFSVLTRQRKAHQT